MKTYNYIKKNGNEGWISINNTSAGQRFFAVTACESKMFKTIAGADRFMTKRGYTLA